MTIKKYFDLTMPEITLPSENERQMIGDAIRIKADADFHSRLAMFKISKFFKREFHFDSFQYASTYDKEDDNECHAYVWTVEKTNIEIKSVVVGGFCFRKREWGGYGFQWIWIHPYLRGTGLLKRHWPLFEDKFGKNFYCEPPYSYAMEKFLSKNDNSLHVADPENRKPEVWFNVKR